MTLMTYKQYLALIARRQRAYIRGEQRRMRKAEKLLLRYTVAMGNLGLHPLTRMEIVDRKRELLGMDRDIATTHGDSEATRIHYENYCRLQPV